MELLMYNAVEPLLFGHGTGVAPMALLIVAVYWAWLWGPIGLLLSTPLTVCLVVLVSTFRPCVSSTFSWALPHRWTTRPALPTAGGPGHGRGRTPLGAPERWPRSKRSTTR